MTNNLNKYLELSEKYKSFTYNNYKYEVNSDKLSLYFSYSLISDTDEDIDFTHTVSYEYKSIADLNADNIKELENIIFSIGLAEMINYYKTVCPKKIEVKCGKLNSEQEKWWQKLFYLGLGEFIYLNGLAEVFTDGKMFEIVSNDTYELGKALSKGLEGFLVPVGGGKDSVVSIEILKNEIPKNENKDNAILPFVMSAPKASYDCIEVARFDSYLKASRIFDKKLFELNEKGFLNGHIPFSAILAFISVLGAVLSGKKYIALSNEKSANEPTVHGQSFNHQYSKSYEFEKDFFEYSRKYLVDDVYYFSLLRPLFEIEIAERFTHYTDYLSVFRSCNRGKKENIWCSKCSKCLFVYIILSPYLEQSRLIEVFHSNMLDDESLTGIFEDLIGITDKKPFECVGTVSEIRYSLRQVLERDKDDAPLLVKKFKKHFKNAKKAGGTDEGHNVPDFLINAVTKRL